MRKKVTLGTKIGMNVSSVNGNQDNLDSKTGFVLGVTAEILLTEKFSLQPELLYSQQGAKSRGNFIYDLNYITLPFMAKYYIAEGFSLEAGPQFSFLVKDELISDNNNAATANTNAENFDLNINFGLGYKLENGIFFQTRYNLGLIAITETPDVKNGVFQMSLGYQF
ncbi:porin family protein [Polaribacter uvawellassae]|uniref:porin family protein n=1 Tax=Polaribacter uvawellassae TaxID=3133495 RepID=UPI00321AE00C